jgi:hypothetical protein
MDALFGLQSKWNWTDLAVDFAAVNLVRTALKSRGVNCSRTFSGIDLLVRSNRGINVMTPQLPRQGEHPNE